MDVIQGQGVNQELIFSHSAFIKSSLSANDNGSSLTLTFFLLSARISFARVLCVCVVCVCVVCIILVTYHNERYKDTFYD
jgi:Ca2+/Na+ antiporter